MNLRETNWSKSVSGPLYERSLGAPLRESNYKWRAQAFPPEVEDWLLGEYWAAKYKSDAEDRIAQWLKSYGRKVGKVPQGLMVDERRVDVQSLIKLEPRVTPSAWDPHLYVLTDRRATECLLLPAGTREHWVRRLGWYSFPLSLARQREVKVQVEALI